mgnify:CR=1 FL=1
MSASAFRYAPRPDRNVELREHIVALAHFHIALAQPKGFGAGIALHHAQAQHHAEARAQHARRPFAARGRTGMAAVSHPVTLGGRRRSAAAQ